MKLLKLIIIVLSTLIVVLSFASPIIADIKGLQRENNRQHLLPTKSYHLKRDVAELHNTGGSSSSNNQNPTVVSGSTSKPTNKAAPTSAPSTDPADIYGGNSITPQNGVAGALLIVLGIYLMVFGFRSFRITLGVCGFLTFSLITWIAMANNQPYYGYVNNDITILAVPAGLGLLGAIIYALFWNISIYLVSALGGLALAMYIMCCKANLLITQVVARAALLVALPFFMSFITFFAERYVLLFTFAFVGSYCFIVGIDFLAHTGYLASIKTILDGNPYHQVMYVISRNVLILIAFISIIFAISFGWQFMYNKGQKFGVIFTKVEVKKKVEVVKKEETPPSDHGKADKSEPHID